MFGSENWVDSGDSGRRIVAEFRACATVENEIQRPPLIPCGSKSRAEIWVEPLERRKENGFLVVFPFESVESCDRSVQSRSTLGRLGLYPEDVRWLERLLRRPPFIAGGILR